MFEIFLSKQASKFIRQADKVLVSRIIEKLEHLKEEPICHDTKRIVGTTFFRVRVGDLRILYKVEYNKNLVVIDKIDKRSKVYDF